MKALIISMGGSPQPIVRSIQEHQPDFVCFFTSEDCVEAIGQVKAEVGRPLKNRNVIVSDFQDLTHCFERAAECGRIVEAEGFGAPDVLVDYTGGTKTLSAALVLATVNRGYQFSYVGGTARTKEGRGAVVDGKEVVLQAANPWDLLALGERERIEWAFNHYAYEVAHRLIGQVCGRGLLSMKFRRLYESLAPLVKGYLHWDRFEHARIGSSLKDGLEALRAWRDTSESRFLDPFLAAVSDNLSFLQQMQQASKGFKKLSAEHVADLLANATRRADEGKYDDAIARLYRALEMAAQVALAERGIETSSVDPKVVPEAVRDEFTPRYLDEKRGVLQLPLYAGYRLLEVLEDPLGVHFAARVDDFRPVMSARNQSILAHGVNVNDRGAFDRFLELITATTRPVRLLEFPKLALDPHATTQEVRA